ncbi:MAG: hydroxymethylbilane synthase [Candidatus Omnitrophota bacterium]|nr:hydroxymethylbilane synthase [Candidatus Omnitrophota bacterium]
MKQTIRIGTRGSALALYQAELVKGSILREFSLLDVRIVVIKTSGDMVRRRSASPLETKRMFTREIEDALLDDRADLAVHSAKDLSVHMPEGLVIGAVLAREDARDCLLTPNQGKKLAELPIGARVGTSSLRRKAQLLRLCPELVVEELHGNVDSRIKKMQKGNYDAIILAYAGIKRLGLTNHVSEILPEEIFYPAPGQGAIVLQSRAGDREIAEVLNSLNDKNTADRLECERAFLARLEGGCQLPCGISTVLDGGRIRTRGALFAIEERKWAEGEHDGDAADAAGAGQTLAEVVLSNGGREILEEIKKGVRGQAS